MQARDLQTSGFWPTLLLLADMMANIATHTFFDDFWQISHSGNPDLLTLEPLVRFGSKLKSGLELTF